MIASILITAALAISAVDARMARRHNQLAARFDKPATYAEGYLEPYDTYHTRYMAVGCQNKHNTPFFDACCHPLLATETLEANRPAECKPGNQGSAAPASSSAAAAAPAASSPATNSASDDTEDCDDGEDQSAPSSSAAAAPVATSAPSSSGGDEGAEDASGGAANNAAAAPPAPAPAPTTSSSPAPAPSPTQSQGNGNGNGNNGGGNGQTGSGQATFFTQNNNAGACGTVHQDSDFVAALQTENYAGGSKCGKTVVITNTKNGKSVTVTVADECPTCVSTGSIDLSTGAFNQIATPEEGMVPITWTMN